MSPLAAGTHRLGPDTAALRVETGRAGAAARAGHDLVIDVTAWEATLEVAEDGEPVSLALDAAPGSLEVREGSGGIQPLSNDDKAEIRRTIDDDVLKGETIEFRSSTVDALDGGERLRVTGDLRIAGASRPVEFELTVGSDGRIAGSTTLEQTDWGIKPYSALFGTLKVADEVEVIVEGSLAD